MDSIISKINSSTKDKVIYVMKRKEIDRNLPNNVETDESNML